MYRTGIITLSDKGSQGLREDKSGPLIQTMLETVGVFQVVKTTILPDDIDTIKTTLIAWADVDKLDLILTTGGTGFSQRDWTPEATIAVCDRLTPGIPEAMRYYSLQITPKAMLSRSAAGRDEG